VRIFSDLEKTFSKQNKNFFETFFESVQIYFLYSIVFCDTVFSKKRAGGFFPPAL